MTSFIKKTTTTTTNLKIVTQIMSALKARKLQRDYRSKGARSNIISRCDKFINYSEIQETNGKQDP